MDRKNRINCYVNIMYLAKEETVNLLLRKAPSFAQLIVVILKVRLSVLIKRVYSSQNKSYKST